MDWWRLRLMAFTENIYIVGKNAVVITIRTTDSLHNMFSYVSLS